MWCELWQALEALNKKDITEIKSYGSLWCHQCLVYLTVAVLATGTWQIDVMWIVTGIGGAEQERHYRDQIIWQATTTSWESARSCHDTARKWTNLGRGQATARYFLVLKLFFTVILSAKFHLTFSSSLCWTCSLSRSIGVLVVTSVKYVIIYTTEAVSSCDTACALLLLRLNF